MRPPTEIGAMPYTVSKDGAEDAPYCVYKADADGQPTGETLGCHDTAEKAGAQIGAVEASEAGSHAMPVPQARIMRAYVARENMAPDPGAPMRFIASTEDIARDGGIVAADGWQLDSYKANPVFLWAHDYSMLPLGRVDVEVKDGRLMADVLFDQADDFARQVEGKYRRGFLNAVSVGWNTLEYSDGRALPDGATWMSLKHELLDISAVPVPADPGALAERQRTLMAAWARSILQPDDSQPTVEPAWPEVAAAMVACFVPAGDDAERLERYNSLLPRYRRLGKTAPEWLDAATVSALGPAERRGLFLSDEPSLCPDAFAEPEPSQDGDDGAAMGSVLAQIQERLENRALQGILSRLEARGIATQRSQAPAPTPEPSAGGDDGKGTHSSTDARPEIDNALRAILEKLESPK